MSKLTKKCFDLVHQKMLASADYCKGYEFGTWRRDQYMTYALDDLVCLRRSFLSIHNQYASGLAYALLEAIYERTSQAGEAA